MEFDPVLFARIQFAFTVSFHIIFPSFTIGLACWLATVEGLWLKTRYPIYKEIYKFWVKIFAVAFGMGVVSGVVMAYQFGTNWSGFADKVASVMGPLMGFEVLTAFFLEASFLGIMLFGWNRVSPKMHLVSTLLVAVGTTLSAFWILSAVSWMHTPAGFEIGSNGSFEATDWLDIVFNPSFPYRFMHMVLAAFLTTACVIAGVGAWYLRRHQNVKHARIMFAMGLFIIVGGAPLQLIIGHSHGLNTLAYQPAKIAAMEGVWETQNGAGYKIFGLPDSKAETTTYSLEIPKLTSLLLTANVNGEVRGLKEWAKEDRPPVGWVFWSFRVMLLMGVLMIATAILAVVLYFRQKLFSSARFQRWCIFLIPSGFIAVLAGWFTTEIGRQPYVVYQLLRTVDMVSPVSGNQVAFSLAAFVIVYGTIFGAGLFTILRLIRKGVAAGSQIETYGQHSVSHPVTLSAVFTHQIKRD